MLAALLTTALLTPARGAPVWPRQPALHGDTIVFAAAGDLWTVSVDGGEARRLTDLPGEESWPRISPGGTTLAFSAEVDGNVEVCTMPLDGGPRRRLTWHPGRDRVAGWTDDGAVLFRSGRRDHSGFGEIFRVDPAAGGPVPLETGRAEAVAVEPGGKRIAIADGDVDWFAWKRNRGGMASRLRAGVAGDQLALVSDDPGRHPMWREDRLLFVDVDDQLASMNLGGVDVRVHGPAREPSLGSDGRIVLVDDGALRVFDPDDPVDPWTDVRITLPDDVGPPTERAPVADHVESVTLAGDRVVVVAYGQVHVHGPRGWRTWAAAPGVRFGPVGVSGGTLWAVADDGGGGWLVSGPVDGRPRRRKGPEGDGWIAVAPSPDGAWVAGVHWDGRVLITPAKKGPAREVGRSPIEAPLTELAWRPGGDLLAFTTKDAFSQRTVQLVSPTGEPRAATSPRTDDHDPVWSADGATLYFVGQRRPDIQLDHRDVAYVAERAGVAMALPVDPNGTVGRGRLLPGAPAVDRLLGRSGAGLLVETGDGFGTLDLETGGVSPQDGGTCLPADPAPRCWDGPLPELPERALTVDRRATWRQMVGESCRQVRDLYWEPGLGGVDWDAACEVARERVDRIATRHELNDVLSELIGELSAAHAFAYGGDTPVRPEGPQPALLGGDVRWTGSGWVVDAVLVPDDTLPTPAPLADAGVAPGECLTRVDGLALDADHPPGARLLDRAGEDIVLTVGPCGGDTREVALRPLRSETALRTADLVRRRAERTRQLSGGQVGYVFMPDVNDLGLDAFERMWAGVRDREAIVLDLRHNGGGWYSDAVVDRLTRRSDAAFQWRSATQTWPIRSAPPRLAVLVDGGTASEGEILARGLQLAGATLIGEPTWGGLSGDHAGRPLVDGGEVRTPGVIWQDPEKGIGFEGQGLVPDRHVPGLRAPGVDPVLQQAILAVLPPEPN